MQIREISRRIAPSERERFFDTRGTSTAKPVEAEERVTERKEDERRARRGGRVCILQDFLELITPTIINVA